MKLVFAYATVLNKKVFCLRIFKYNVKWKQQYTDARNYML